ncbi:MAG: heme-binding protein [Gammaproteobacteria bacterium]
MHVTLEQAQIALAAAQKKAVEIDTRMCIAVVDSGANLKAFVRTTVNDLLRVRIAHPVEGDAA